MLRYEVIMSHADQPEEGVFCQVEATTANRAQAECLRATGDPDSMFFGYEFTIWPVAVGPYVDDES
jgi:hypothetical protein